MEISILLSRKIFSMFLACIIGFVTVRIRLLKVDDTKVFSKLLAFICTPCAMISAFQVAYSQGKLFGLLAAFLLAVAVHILFLVITALISKGLKLNAVEKAAIIYPNAGNLTIPIVYAVLGPEWVFYTCAFSTVQQFLIWTHGKSILSSKPGFEWKKVMRNPCCIASCLGLGFFILRLKLPQILSAAVSDFSSLLGPVSMLITGMLIGSEKMKRFILDKRSYLIIFLRLIVMPVIVLICFRLLKKVIEIDGIEQIMLIVLWAAAGPVASMVCQLSQIYGKDGQYAGRLNMLSTVFSIITMPLVTFLYQL